MSLTLPPAECYYVTEECLREWKSGNANFRVPKPVSPLRFLFELCSTTVRGELPFQKCKAALDSVEFTERLSREELGSTFADVVTQMAQDHTKSGECRARLIKLAKWLVESTLVPLRVFQERCEEEFLWEAEMIKIKAQDLKGKEVRVNTRLLYQQTKFNLLREESEGYAKLYYQRMEVNSPAPSGLYRLTALLVKEEFIDLDSIYAHLLPKNEDAFEHYNVFSSKRLDEANKIGKVNLAATGKELMDDEKQGDVTVDLFAALDMETEAVVERSPELENNQTLGLLTGFLSVNDWYHANILFHRLSPLNPVAHIQICNGLFRLIKKAIAPACDIVHQRHDQSSGSPSVAGIDAMDTSSSGQRSFVDLPKELFQMLATIGPYLYRDTVLLQKVCRVLRGYYLSALELVDGEGSAHGEPAVAGYRVPCMHLREARSRIEEALGTCLLPSLQLIPANPAVGQEIWEVMSLLPYEVRYRLYGEWEKDDERNPMVLAARQTAKVHITQGDHEGKGVIVSWVTVDEPGSNTVLYWSEKSKIIKKAEGKLYTYRFFNYTSGFIHHTTIRGLKYNTKYYYELGIGNTTRFTTPPAVGLDVPYTFGLIGDLGQSYDSNKTLAHYEMNPHKGKAVLFVGDLSYADNYPNHDNVRWDTWGRFVERNVAYQPWIWTAGNHEIDFAPEIGETKPFKPYTHRYHVPYKPFSYVQGLGHYSPRHNFQLKCMSNLT